tara:strand:- start:420 stop:1985 length:1566 start_codon:yes stop_codon:yes gene_type:complete
MIIFGEEARQKLMEGIDLVADTVAPTLGPQARTVILESEKPIIINDGVTIAKHISHPDQFVNMGVKLMQSVAGEAQGYSGDGTTTASILARAISKRGMEMIESDGISPVKLKTELDVAVNLVIAHLMEKAIPVEDNETIKNVATISANNDEKLGALISEVIERVGKDGVISVQEANSIETTIEVVDGLQIPKGFISHLMMNKKETAECIFENPLIFMCNADIRNAQDIIPVMEIALSNKRPLLIIAKSFEGTALNSLLFNLMHKTIECAVIPCPNFGDEAIEEMEDMTAILGGSVYNVDIGADIAEVKFDDLAQCDRVTITKASTTFIGGNGNGKEERLSTLNAQLENAPNDWFVDKIKYRMGRISGGVAVIKVGGATEVEMMERKERLDDALNATRAAMQEGVVIGGGKSLIEAIPVLKDVEGNTINQGSKLLQYALRQPLQVLFDNGQNQNKFDTNNLHPITFTEGFGYNALTDTIDNLMESGIIDPVKVTRSSLQAAASIAGMVLTTEVLVGADEVLV